MWQTGKLDGKTTTKKFENWSQTKVRFYKLLVTGVLSCSYQSSDFFFEPFRERHFLYRDTVLSFRPLNTPLRNSAQFFSLICHCFSWPISSEWEYSIGQFIFGQMFKINQLAQSDNFLNTHTQHHFQFRILCCSK